MYPEAENIPLTEQLKLLFHYCPETGELRWRSFFTVNPKKWGKVATKKYDSYLSVNVARANLPAHRIVWCMCYGEWPPGTLEHINGDKTDNRIENLRLSRGIDPMEKATDIPNTPHW